MRGTAVVGFALVGLMQVVFFLTGAGRPAPYREMQVLGLLGTALLVAACLGPRARTAALLAVGFALNGAARIMQVVLGLSRLPLWLNLGLFAAWVLAAVSAARRSGPWLRGAVWALGALHAIALAVVVARLEAAIALALGAAGLMLAAPSVGREE